jgi:hypothetical protein
MVVDLAVADEHNLTVLAVQRLLAPSRINDRKPPESEPDIGPEKELLIVRPAMRDPPR